MFVHLLLDRGSRIEPVRLKSRTCLHSGNLVMLGDTRQQAYLEGSSQLGCSQSESALNAGTTGSLLAAI